MRKSPRDPQHRPVSRTTRLVLALLLGLALLPLPGRPSTAAPATTAAPTAVTMTSRTRTALALGWSAVTGAAGYQVRYARSSGMSGSRTVAADGPSAELTGLGIHRKYYVQVRALDATGVPSAWSAKKSYYTLTRSGFTVLPPVGLTATPSGSTSLKVSFTARPGAAKYMVAYGRTATSRRQDRHTVTGTSLVIPGLESGTSYYLRVRALSSSGKAISYYSDYFTKAPVKATTGAAYQSGVAAASVASESLRVASFNIKCAGCDGAGELPWAQRRNPVAATIADQHPDVIGLQEASQASMPGTTLNQYDDLVELLGDPYRLTNAYRYNCATSTSSNDCSPVSRGASQSVRIVYNAETLALLATGSLKLAAVSSKDNDRFLAWARLRQISTGKVFVFATTHLQPNRGGSSTEYVKSYFDLRARQARQIRDELASVAGGLPVILTGDMNSRWNSPGPGGTEANPQYEVFTAAGFRDPLNGGTKSDRAKGPAASVTSLVNVEFNSCNTYSATPPTTLPRGNNIDYVYLRGGITPTAWETVVDVDGNGVFRGVIPSDHNLIRADVELP